ncbi:hypothetical protein TIFTF001_015011 [Ficus carica]|uniref:Uncharacterized protein n=1 Tax=Ficus carica TaxID=3494 RepID=A0AA88A740_FICCA|nr:hypothetical protein TIFTF001_015011 [Ficus carica]
MVSSRGGESPNGATGSRGGEGEDRNLDPTSQADDVGQLAVVDAGELAMGRPRGNLPWAIDMPRICTICPSAGHVRPTVAEARKLWQPTGATIAVVPHGRRRHTADRGEQRGLRVPSEMPEVAEEVATMGEMPEDDGVV